MQRSLETLDTRSERICKIGRLSACRCFKCEQQIVVDRLIVGLKGRPKTPGYGRHDTS